MFRLENVSLRYANREVFKGINWQVSGQDRVGLVGPNGAGKTTLLKLLCHQQEIDKGSIFVGKSSSLGYLPQEGIVHHGKTLFEEAKSVFSHIIELKEKLHTILQELETCSHDDPNFSAKIEYSHHLEDQFRNADGYSIESNIGLILKGLGFEKDDWTKPVEAFSGGWQMRIALSKLLLQKPTLLLLDEPTNHLDIEAREWLADYLVHYPFSLVMVSHDRYFLDKVITRIAEIQNSTIIDYHGNYSYYLKEKELRRIAHEAAYKRQQEEIAHIETFINRFRYKESKAIQVQSRIKMLEKIERIPPPEAPMAKIKVRFPEPLRSGDIVMDLINISKSYGDKKVLENIELNIRRGERIALVGPNGAGKSTLMRILSAVEPPDSGIRRLGHQVIASYFAQDQSKELKKGNRVLEELATHAPLLGEGTIRSLLGNFLFTSDDVYKQVTILSGGEKNRLALCKLLAVPGNLLLLDEPTNHLDMASKELLLEALEHFQGTIVFVSHDRIFLEELANRIVDVGNGKIDSYPGKYEDFLAYKKRNEDALLAKMPLQTSQQQLKQEALENNIENQQQKTASDHHKDRKKTQRQQNKLKERVVELEKLIEENESLVVKLEEEMHNPVFADNYPKLLLLEEERNKTSDLINNMYNEWEAATNSLESFLE